MSATNPGPAVEVERLRRVFVTKRRPKVIALADVSLTVESGEVHGLLGPNGAGKTTVVKVLSKVLLPSSGTARVMGFDVVKETAAVRPLIGIVLGGERGLYNRLTARQNLRYWCALYKMEPDRGRARTDALLEGFVLIGWLALSLATFRRLADTGRHDGSIVFSSG